MHHRIAPSSRRGLTYVTIAGIAWGTGGPTGALLFEYAGLGSTAVSFWRLTAAALWLALARLVLRRGPVRRLFAASPLRYVGSGLGLAVCQLGYFAAIPRVGVAIATVIALGAGPFFIALGARERITVALLVAVVGLFFLVSGDGSASIPGIIFALLSGAGYALTTLLNRNEPDPLSAAYIGFVAGAVFLLPLAITDGVVPTAVGWPLIAYFGLVPTALAYSLFYVSLRTLRASTAAVIALIEPVVAASLGVLLLHERLGAVSVAGGVVLLAAVVVHARQEASR